MALRVPQLPIPQLPVPSAGIDGPVTVDDTIGMAADNTFSSEVPEGAWSRPDIEPVRWDQYFPYQLLVLRASKGESGVVYAQEPGWSFTFPIPPSRIAQQTLFAIRVSATLGGVNEDHNGIVFQDFSLQGTLGVLPARGTANRSRVPAELTTIGASATINALGNLSADIDRFSVGNDLAPPNVHSPDEFDVSMSDSGDASLLAKTSGYVQYQQMLRFLESYAEIKKVRAGVNLRLGFAVWKEKSVWLVTPRALEVSRDPGLDRHYALSLRAWRRITLEAGQGRNASLSPIRKDLAQLARLSATLRSARRVLTDAKAVMQAIPVDVGANIDAVLDPIREASMFVGDLRGLRATAADMPQAIRDEIAPVWAAAQGGPRGAQAIASAGNPATHAALKSASAASKEAQGANAASASHPANSALGADAGSDLLESVQVDSLPLPLAIRKRVAAERGRISGLKRVDFEARLASIRTASATFATAVGAGDPDASAALGIEVQPVRSSPTDLDWTVMNSMEEAACAVAALAATADGGQDDGPSSVDVMAGLARRAGAAFTAPRSKYAAPFPARGTIESAAQLYLGSADLAPELIALNGLRPPYVDEEGFSLPLLVNGSGDQVVVQHDLVQSRLYVGQPVRIAADTVPEARRRVSGLRKVGNTLVVSVDGPPNMNFYRAGGHPELRAYLPDTVNSGQLIWIPSDSSPADDPVVDPSIPGVDAFDPEIAAGGVDLLLDASHDLVLGSDGSAKLVAGRANVIQSLGVDLDTERGTVPGHPEIGLPLAIGSDTAGTSAKAIADAARRMVRDDPAFAGVEDVRVEKDGPVTTLRVSPILAGTRQLIPIRFRAPRERTDV